MTIQDHFDLVVLILRGERRLVDRVTHGTLLDEGPVAIVH